MTLTEHLLTILAEEGNEVAHRASKALRFGLHEVQPGQTLTNAQRLGGEVVDLLAALDLCDEAGIDLGVPVYTSDRRGIYGIEAKKKRVEAALAYSAQCGTLTPDPPTDLLEEAAGCIRGLAGQQAMPDDSYLSTLEDLEAEIARRRGDPPPRTPE